MTSKIDIKKAEEIYQSSIKVLKSVQLDNGGCLATPKGERYPYIYPRDHAFCVLAFLDAGMMNEAKMGLEFVFNQQLKTGAFPQRYDVDGNDASYKPVQIDGSGLILFTLAEYVKKTKELEFAEKNWKKIIAAADYIKENIYNEKDLVFTPNSIHEFPPMERGLEIWANCTCCAALREIHKIAQLLKIDSHYNILANRIKSGIVNYMWNSRLNSFIKTIRIKESSSVETNPDASALALSEFDIIPDDNEKMKSTVERIEKTLWNKDLGGICRYPKHSGRNNGGWGPWPHFTLLMCKYYIKTGNREKAEHHLKWVLDVAHENMLPEHIATVKEFREYVTDFKESGLLRKDRIVMIKNVEKHPMFKKGIAYAIAPLAWPHAEFIRTWKLYRKVFGIDVAAK